MRRICEHLLKVSPVNKKPKYVLEKYEGESLDSFLAWRKLVSHVRHVVVLSAFL